MSYGKFLTVGVALTLFIGIQPTFAGQQTGVVTSVATPNDGSASVFLVSGASTGKPPCATDSYWAISNPSSDSAKAVLSTVLTAFALKSTINVVGTNSCDAQNTNRENIKYIVIGP